MPQPPSPAVMGAPAPASIGAPQVAPNYGALMSLFRPNPWLQLLQAAGQFPQQQQQAKLDKLALQQGQQNLELQSQQMDEYRTQKALQNIQMFGQILKARPALAGDDQTKQTLGSYFQQAGVPMPLDEQGNIDLNFFKQQFDALTPDEQLKLHERGLELQPGPARTSFYANYAGVPTEWMTEPQSFDARDQAGLMKARTYGLKEEDDAGFLKAREQYYAYQEDPTNPRNIEYMAQARKNIADAQAIPIRAQADVTRANAAALNAYNRANGLTGAQQNTAMRTAASAVLSAYDKTVTQIDAYNKAQQTLLANDPGVADPNPDPNDPNVALYQSNEKQLQQLQAQQTQLQQAKDAALQYDTSHFTTTSLQTQPGVRAVTTQPVGKQPPPAVTRTAQGGYTIGQVYPYPDGRKMKYLGGPPNDAASWQQQ